MEKIQGYLKEEDGKQFLVFSKKFKIEVAPEITEKHIFRMTPSLDTQMALFKQVIESNIPCQVDRYDFTEWLEERMEMVKADAEECEYDAVEVMVHETKSYIENIMTEQYYKVRKLLNELMDDYAKCFLWKSLGFDTYPLEWKDGKLMGTQEDIEIELTK